MAKQQIIKIIITEDGSHSLQLKELDETYHSIHGAIQESNHVYIEAGLNYWLHKNLKSTSVKILELGFGTGLNAMLTAITVKGNVKASYRTIEKYPLAKELTDLLNHGEILHNSSLFNTIHSVSWGEEHQLTPNFSIKKTATDFENFSTPEQYDLIYFDAFAPAKQPELWTKSIFEHCYKLLNKGGVLVTYSAKGQLKRDLRSIGFLVESLPGPPGKFEITRAIK